MLFDLTRRAFLHLICTLALTVSLSLAAGAEPPSTTPGWAKAHAAQQRHTERLLEEPGIVGTALGLGHRDTPVLVIYTEAANAPALPGHLDGVRVERRVIGKIFARHHCKGAHFDPAICTPPTPEPEEPVLDPTSMFPRPVPIGISAGHEGLVQESGALYCTTGTLGFRAIAADGTRYAVSNAHVLALEGGAPLIGVAGGRVLQPGRADLEGCGDPSGFDALEIGSLAEWVPLDFDNSTCVSEPDTCNRVDAAIAIVDPANVGTATPSDGYGAPSEFPLQANIDLIGTPVHKYGRTTGYTTGTVAEINATINVQYGRGVATFTGQIRVVDNRRGGRDRFSRSGDSGSLIASRDGNHPVGLLFAGGTFATFANPIGEVLGTFELSVEGTN